MARITNWFTSFFGGRQRGDLLWNQTQLLGQAGPVWVETEDAYELYNLIPQLKTAIDRKASMFANMEIKLYNDKSGDVVPDPDLDALIQNPNPLQPMNAWLREFKTQEQVYGNQFLRKFQASRLSKYPQTLFNISPAYMWAVATGKIWDQTTIEGIISEYRYTLKGVTQAFDPKEVLYSRITDINNPIVGKSPIHGLKLPISNIKLAYEYRNVIMGEKGAMGILSNQSKDANGAIPLTDKERERIEKQYTQSYGIRHGQKRVVITNASLNWQPTSYPTKDMMLFEEIDADMITIADAFGLNINIFGIKNATYENVKQSILQTYQDTIIPEADQFAQSLTKFLNVPQGFSIKATYDHLQIMKDSKLSSMVSVAQVVNFLNAALTSGIIEGQQATNILANELGIKPAVYKDTLLVPPNPGVIGNSAIASAQ